MASYFNLTLDTAAPEGLTLSLTGNSTASAGYTNTAAVTLTASVADADTTGYQMKVWGYDGVESEDLAVWEDYAASKSITLTSGDGLKTVYAAVRDDVGNESAAASASITLDTAVPVITITGPDHARISKVSGYDTANFSFTVDTHFTQYMIRAVPETTSSRTEGVLLTVELGYLGFDADVSLPASITASDLETAGIGDDGVKIIKIFARNDAGTWNA